MSLSVHFLAAVLSWLGGDGPWNEAWFDDPTTLTTPGGSLSGAIVQCDYRTPTIQSLAELPKWIDQLGDDGFETRERASRRLVGLGRAARPALVQGLACTDAEVRRRCAVCLEDMDNLERSLGEQLRLALIEKMAYEQQIKALRDTYGGEKYPKLTHDTEVSAHECQRRAEQVERILRQWGLSGEELEKIKREAGSPAPAAPVPAATMSSGASTVNENPR